jgi:hypothetical protein
MEGENHFASPAHLVGAVGTLTKSVVAFAFLSRFGFDPFLEPRRTEEKGDHGHRD